MIGETFEYEVKKDVRNNPIVREVDQERHREMWRSTLIGVFLVVVLLFSAWQRVELQQHGYQFEQLLQELADEELVNRHLRLEVETLRAPARIEQVATRQLRMVAPEASAAIVLERVAATPAPPPSVVARR
jgi:cell division protein FtsL